MMNSRLRHSFKVGAALSAWLIASFASATSATHSQVDDILSGLVKAVRELNYRGAFTYEYGGIIDTLQISHSVFDGSEYEVITYLAGPEREFSRIGRPLSCTTTGTRLLRGAALVSPDDMDSAAQVALKQNYEFYLRGDERIAGRLAHTLQIVPTDEYRYGFTLSIDAESGLLTKSLVVSHDKKVIERMQFVSLDVDVDFDKSEFVGSEVHYSVPALQGCEANVSKRSPWRPSWVPKGFVFASASHSREDGHMESYTDGLATFSVFVKTSLSQEKIDKANPASLHKSSHGIARRGATLALLSTMPSKSGILDVTVVGEIPPKAARKITSSIQQY